MEQLFVPFLITALVFCGITIFFLLTKFKGPSSDKAMIEWLQSMQRTIDETHRTLQLTVQGNSSTITNALQENTKQLNTRLDAASRIMYDLQRHVGEMSEVGRGIKSLQEFLQSPKLRGNIGEQVLADMIGQTFPKGAFHLQYAFTSGVIVDAVLKTDAGLLCIDAKFPMEQFERIHSAETEELRQRAKKAFVADVKKHLHDIHKKYIIPDEGTMDFALMYIPSESVYYEVSTIEDILSYARSLRVYPVSPNTLYAHLQVLLLSFEGKNIEQQTRQVFRVLRMIRKDYEQLSDAISRVTKHVTHAHTSLQGLSLASDQLSQSIQQTHLLDEPKRLKEN